MSSPIEYLDFALAVDEADTLCRSSGASVAGETTTKEFRWEREEMVATPGGRVRDVQAPLKLDAGEAKLRRYGKSLFDTFFADDIRDLYRETVALARTQRKGVRVKLLIDSPALASLPWELLFDSRHGRHLALYSKTPVVRHLKLPEPIEPLGVELPLKILGMTANPGQEGLARLDVARERQLIDTALEGLREEGLVELEWLENGTWEGLLQAMWQGWHAFHFVGHGGVDSAEGSGFLIMEDGQGGARRVGAHDLGILLRGEGNINLAVLNSCQGATSSDSGSFGSTADELAKTGIGGVVAMQNSISDDAAITFAQVLYLGIAAGRPVDTAVTSARVAMKLEHLNANEWWTPVLHMRASDGALFRTPSAVVEDRPSLAGAEYLDPDLDRRLHTALKRRRWLTRAVYAWLLAPVPLLAYLLASTVSFAEVNADVWSTGVTFETSEEGVLFTEMQFVDFLAAYDFEKVQPPESIEPVTPSNAQRAEIAVISLGDSGVALRDDWTLPAGSKITFGYFEPDYQLRIVADTGTQIQVGATLKGPVRTKWFQDPPRDSVFGMSPLVIHAGHRELRIDTHFSDTGGVELPPLSVTAVKLSRYAPGHMPPERSTVERAMVRWIETGRVDTLAREGVLIMEGLEDATLENLRLGPGGISFEFDGRVDSLVVGNDAVPDPSKLKRWLATSPFWVGFAALTYVLVALVGMLTVRTNHVTAQSK